MTDRTRRVWALLFLAAVPCGSARADNLDLRLVENASGLVRACRDHGYHNVGTLRFQVKGAAGPGAEPLGAGLADRVENLLVIGSDAERPADGRREERPELGVIRAAGEVAAARDAHADALTPAGRKALFEHAYPLAWGEARVSADAFLTGEIEFAADLLTARVQIDGFDRSGTVARLLSFVVDTDRSLLADAGLAFQLDRKARESRSPARLDAAAVATAAARRKEAPTAPASRSEFLGVSFLVDGKPQPLEPTQHGATVPAPKIGQAVTLRLKNLTGARLGVLVKVNGRNSIGEGIDEGCRCRRWLLEPGRDYPIKGYRVGDGPGAVRPFKIPSGVPKAELAGERADLIELQVFLPGEREEHRRAVSLRGLSPAERAGSAAWTFRDLQSRLARRGGLVKTSPRTVTPDDAAPPVQEELADATFAEYRRIRVEPPGE